jgi:hypothetical protein
MTFKELDKKVERDAKLELLKYLGFQIQFCSDDAIREQLMETLDRVIHEF